MEWVMVILFAIIGLIVTYVALTMTYKSFKSKDKIQRIYWKFVLIMIIVALAIQVAIQLFYMFN
jgi:uncharacterized membrane protein